MIVNCDREDLFGRVLANDVLVHVLDNFTRGQDLIEELFLWTASLLLLIENTLAQFDTLVTDVDITGTLDQRADVSIVLATERAVCIFFGRTTTARAS